MLIIEKFSPSHYAISNIFESTGTSIRLWIAEKDSVQQSVIRLIIYVILIIGSEKFKMNKRTQIWKIIEENGII